MRVVNTPILDFYERWGISCLAEFLFASEEFKASQLSAITNLTLIWLHMQLKIENNCSGTKCNVLTLMFQEAQH
jgi:hypothetical protein